MSCARSSTSSRETGTSEPDPRVARLGILGGTFNPPHEGHVRCALQALAQLNLDRVLLMPVRVPPHKEAEDDPGIEHRLAMCRLAVGDDERLGVSELELRRPGPSYTVDTLRALHEDEPARELAFILGADMARTLPQWREPTEILSLARLAVAERDGTAREEIRQALAELRGEDRVDFLDLPAIDVSSSALRERVAAGQSIDGLVPDAVAAYIAEHCLYQRDPDASDGPAILSSIDALRSPRPDRRVLSPTAAPERDRPAPDELVRSISALAADKKAQDIVELDLRGVLGYTDYFVICTGNTERQTKAIHDGILRGLKDEASLTPRRVEGLGQARWILMDYLDVVVHIFTPETREYYRLEQLWGEAPMRLVVDGD